MIRMMKEKGEPEGTGGTGEKVNMEKNWRWVGVCRLHETAEER